MIYTVVLDALLLDHLPGLKQPTQIRTNAVVAFILLKRLFVFFGQNLPFLSMGHMSIAYLTVRVFYATKNLLSQEESLCQPFFEKKFGKQNDLCLNFMVDLCKAKPCLNQFINQTRSSSLGLHLFSAATFHKIESRCLHSRGTMLFCSV